MRICKDMYGSVPFRAMYRIDQSCRLPTRYSGLKLESCTGGHGLVSGIRLLDPHDRVTVVYSYSDVHVSGLDSQVRPFFCARSPHCQPLNSRVPIWDNDPRLRIFKIEELFEPVW